MEICIVYCIVYHMVWYGMVLYSDRHDAQNKRFKGVTKTIAWMIYHYKDVLHQNSNDDDEDNLT